MIRIMPFLAVNRLSGKPGESANVPPRSALLKLPRIDDNATMQAALQRALGRRGMDVTPCHDGRQALDQARRQGLRIAVLIVTARGTMAAASWASIWA